MYQQLNKVASGHSFPSDRRTPLEAPFVSPFDWCQPVKILLAEGDRDLLDVIVYALRRHGFNVLVATNGKEVLRRWENDQPDIVVLGQTLPPQGGLEVCRAIRRQSATPVLLLMEDPTDELVRRSMAAGADAYVTKPLDISDLASQVQTLAVRTGSVSKNLVVYEPVGTLAVGDLTLDAEMLQAECDGQSARLTRTEFRLLYLLALNAGRVIATYQLGGYVGGSTPMDSLCLRVHMSHLRRKLQLPRHGRNSIEAIPRVGYRLSAAEDKS